MYLILKNSTAVNQKTNRVEDKTLKLKLSHKLLAAFLLSSLVTIILLTSSALLFSVDNFAKYLGEKILEDQNDLISALKKEYTVSKGWDNLRGSMDRWEEILESMKPFRDMGYDHHEPEPPTPESRADDEMLPPPDHEPPFINPDNIREELKTRFPERFERWEKSGRLPQVEERIRRNIMKKRPDPAASMITLFDENLRPVAGRGVSSDNHILKKIEINEKTIGWLGFRLKKFPFQSQDSDFMKRQSVFFIIAGICVLIISSLISYVISRHLLKPVKDLAEATKAMAARNFETRIEVKSGDELGQLAEEFNQLALTLKKYEDLRKQWISDISHELRTPVSILKGEIEAIMDGVRNFTPEAAESLHTETIRLERLIRDLHDLSIAESGALKIIREPVRPVQILKKVLSSFSKKLDEQRIKVSDLTDDLSWATVIGDSDRLAQVFSNLIENTIRYTFSPGKLMISAKQEKKQLTICFEDSAPSVPTDALPKLFDRLFRVDESRSRKTGGSGIGLSLCKNIIEIHGGTITAADSSQGGVKIEICLPLSNEDKS